MRLMLTAVNAKYIHSNLAIYSLRAYAGQYREHLLLEEFTINQSLDFILRELYKKKPDVLFFSCYIWNISYVGRLIRDLHQLRPELPIWVGGPEVSFESEAFLEAYPMVTGVLLGEGEATFLDLCRYYTEQDKEAGLSDIPGLLLRQGETLVRTGERRPLSMDELPFCYDADTLPEHRILYYESSRGCPFSCSYCLSSVDKCLRFKSIPRVERELAWFLERGVRQVKFVDRTFNCKKEHALAVWSFLRDHDNGITNFHFEIAADLLTEEEMELIETMRPGLIQLEIGVQSTNPETIREIRRSMDIARLEGTVRRVAKAKTVHQHLDLIAGLPHEGYESFRSSFDRIYALHAQQLQLGFLKVLKGSFLYENRREYGIRYHEEPPYEVLATSFLSYDELLRIKLVEEMLEIYYNSGQFALTIWYLELAFPSPFDLYLELGRFYEERGHGMQHSRVRRAEILLEFALWTDEGHGGLYAEAASYDLYHRERLKKRPAWALDPAEFGKELKSLNLKGKNVHAEPFFYELRDPEPGERQEYPKKRDCFRFYLFSYEERDRIGCQAAVSIVERLPEEVQKGIKP